VQGASDAGLIPMFFPDYKSVEAEDIRSRYQDEWGRALDVKRGLTVVEVMDAIHAGTIRSMFIMGENPAMSDPDQHHAREALAKLEHLVVQDIFLTETAWHADVVLPASAHAEKLGSFSNTNRQVQLGRPVLAPPGEARQDWELVQEMARRIGLDWRYAGPAEIFAEMASLMPSLANISWERLEREGCVTYPSDGPDQPGHDILFGERFPTASGRGRIVPAQLRAPDETPDADYPMVLTTGRMLEHWHTGAMSRRSAPLDALEPEAVASLNARDMARMGLAPGDTIRVATRRGDVTLKARQDRDVAEGMVFIPFCFAEAPANVLTNPQLDPFGNIPEFKYCAARVEKLADAAE
jgi:formate dehydrogenase major subunit